MASSPPPTKPSTPRLSDRAKLAYPSGIVTTGWPEVHRWLTILGIVFDWFQEAIAKLALAKRADGMYAAGVGGVVLSIPRQVGKTFMLGGLLFALCLIFPGTTALWTSHQLRTTKETLRSMQGFARKKSIKPFVAGVRVANGEGEIEFVNGSRIMFGAREFGFGLGFANVDIIVFDESQRLSDKALDDMLPTQNRAKNPLFFIVGTPPRPTDSGEVFLRKRTEALSGTSDDLLYVEFSADKDKTPRDRIDWEQVENANPSYPTHTPRAAILRMWKNLGATSFWREGYGIWDDDSGPTPTISAEQWRNRRAEAQDDQPVAAGPVAIGIKFSRDGDRVAAAAARKPDGHGPHVEALGEWPTTEGIALLETLLIAQWRKLAAIVVDGQAGRDVLLADLKRARIPARILISPTVPQVIAANATFLTAVEDSTLTHANQPGLNASVATATKRAIGTSGGFGWEAIGDGDETPTEAAALAVWAASNARRTATMPRSF
ncbi:MAG: hypothetical protein QM804_10275 [Propionicimonas sp.]